MATDLSSPTAWWSLRKWFQQIWSDLKGASTHRHPAPFPERLIRMFSFVGDTVLDPELQRFSST